MADRRSADYAALVLRLSLGMFFILHVYRKFAVIGFDSWWSGLIKAGYPDWTLYYTLAAECAGAVLIIPGIYTRYVALLTLPVLIAVTRHWAIRKGLWFTDGGAEFPLAWSLMLLAQVLLGDGAFALGMPTLPWERRWRRMTAAAGE
jgi:putative oxidoreductase